MNLLKLPFKEVKEYIDRNFQQLASLQNTVGNCQKTWDDLKPLLEKVGYKILPKHSESMSNRKTLLYLYVTEILVNFIDMIEEKQEGLKEDMVNGMAEFSVLGFQDISMKEFEEFAKLKNIKDEAQQIKNVFQNNFPELTEDNPYACYTKADFELALQSFKKAMNKGVTKTLILNALELLVGCGALNIWQSAMPNQEVYSIIIFLLATTIFNIPYFNKIDNQLEAEEQRHEELEKQYELYLKRQQQKNLSSKKS